MSTTVLMEQVGMVGVTQQAKKFELDEREQAHLRARRTAFIARFIVLREAKRSRAHRLIEMMEWDDMTTVEEMYQRIRQAFVDNKDSMGPVDRDMRRALAHADRSLNYFIREYDGRATRNFVEALEDYGRSNCLLFGDDDQPKPGGWRLPRELKKIKAEGITKPRA